jgi:Domain of unknown function (DUF4032)/Lipopolysaccharide kinase (Kdo/WaaP) family
MVVRLQFVPGNEPGGLLDLPWSAPLAGWDDPRLVDMVHGTSRHVVRFVADAGRVFALKETTEHEARREYGMLRRLTGEGLPAVQPTGMVTGRRAPKGEPLAAVLVTRYLDFSLPYRYLLTQERRPDLSGLLIDAGVVLLVRLHLEGFFWGDCSLSNLLFRRDAGALMAYLVDAETAERRDELPDGMRASDIDIARENIAGGLLDLQASGELGPEIDVVEVADQLEDRYRALWDELTGTEELSLDDRHLIDRRIRRLNELGFDVDELLVEHDPEGYRLRVRPVLVEEGHHARELRRLTGLDVQENQARRLLNDIAAFGAAISGEADTEIPQAVVASRWLAEVYEPVIARVPDALRGRLEPPELFHELLEHRYYMSEPAGREVSIDEALRSYVDSVLTHRRDEQTVLKEAGSTRP